MPMRRKVAIVFQDPASSLNPRMTIGESIGEPLFLHEKLRKAALAGRVEQLLDSVHLRRDYRYRYPARALRWSTAAGRHRAGAVPRTRAARRGRTDQRPRRVGTGARAGACSRTCRSSTASPACSSVTTSRWWRSWPSRSPCCTGASSPRSAHGNGFSRDPQDPYTKRLLAAAPVPDPTEQGIRREERRVLMAAGADDDEAVPFNPQEWNPPPGEAPPGRQAAAVGAGWRWWARCSHDRRVAIVETTKATRMPVAQRT